MSFSPNFDSVALPYPTFIPEAKGDFRNGYTILVGQNRQIQIGFDEAIKALEKLYAENAKKDRNITVLSTVIDKQEAEFAAAADIVETLTLKSEAGETPDIPAIKSRITSIERNFNSIGDRYKIEP